MSINTVSYRQVDWMARMQRPLPARLVPRQRLFARLDAARASARAAWVEGPIGSGKTALAATWAEARRLRPMWVRVDECAGDPASVLHQLAVAGRPTGPCAVPSLAPADRIDLRRYTASAVERAFRLPGASNALIFDSWHALTDPAAAAAITEGVLDGVPAGAMVLFLTRGSVAGTPVRVPRLGPDDLAFDVRDTEALARSCGCTDRGEAGGWLDATAGWAAGIALLARGRSFGVAADLDAVRRERDHESFFARLADDVMACLPEAVRRFLGALSVLPRFTRVLGRSIGEMDDTNALLDGLCREQFFIERDGPSDADNTVFRLSPVFRSYLARRFAQSIAADARHAVAVRAIRLLEQAGWLEDALAVALTSGDGQGVARLVCVQAAARLDEGRSDLVVRWVSQLPQALRQTSAWVSYYYGVAVAARESELALDALEHAWGLFEGAGEWHGARTVVLAALEVQASHTVHGPRDSVWLSRLDAAGDESAWPSDADEARALAHAGGLLRLAPAHRQLDVMSERARVLAPAARGATLAIRLAAFAAFCALERARPGAEHALAAWRRAAGDDDLAPARGALAAAHVACAARIADSAAAVSAWREGVAFIARSGIRQDDNRLRVAAILALPATADEVLRDQPEPDLASIPVAVHDQVAFQVAGACIERWAGRLDRARNASLDALATALRAGASGEEALARVSLIPTLIAQGEQDAAAGMLAAALPRVLESDAPHLQFVLHLFSAQLAQQSGDRNALLVSLEAAVGIGANFRCLSGHPWCAPAVLAGLVAEALRHNLAPAYVRSLVRAAALPAPHPADDRWPWPLRVRLLGAFELRLDGEAIHYGRKTPKRALELLKLVALYGPQPLPVETVFAALWPDADRDAARRSFDVTVHRLRALLGNAAMVHVEGGHIGLDASTCWVDCWHIASASALTSDTPLPVRVAHLISLYRGRLLPDDDTHTWLMPRRDQLHATFLGLVAAYGDELEAGGQQSHADSLYRHALEVDPYAEPLNRRMIAHFLRTGRTAEAVAHYRRLEQQMTRLYGMKPVVTIEALVRPHLH